MKTGPRMHQSVASSERNLSENISGYSKWSEEATSTRAPSGANVLLAGNNSIHVDLLANVLEHVAKLCVLVLGGCGLQGHD